MATFREKIEAFLKARDAGRFAAAMNAAARSVHNLESVERQAVIQSAILDEILEELRDQTAQNAAAFHILSGQVDNLTEEIVELGAATAVTNTVMKKSGSNAVFLGKSWAFWKDRLSLTRSEIYTTALTIGAYLSPALIALGSSFAYAAVGGGAVAASGMASFLLGLGGIVSIASPVIDGIKKIQKAQDQLNMAIDQYGAASIQASRANAHLYAVIQNNGGPAVAGMLSRVQDLKEQWKIATQPGQQNLIGMMTEGVSAGQKLTPLAASLSNQIVGSLRGAVREALSDLTSPESQSVMRSAAGIFSGSAGNGIRGVTNVLVVFGRVIKASAPWLKRFAASWANMTKNFRQRATQDAVNKFLNEAVSHTRAWWGLIKEVGRTFGLILKGSRLQGRSLVLDLTNVIEKFNDWLQMMEDTGKVDSFFEAYNNSLKDIVWALQNPMNALDRFMPEVIAAINTYLPKVMDAIANTLATHGPQAAGIFLKAFMDAGNWAKFFTVSALMLRFGVFSKIGGLVAATFLKPFLASFTASFTAAIGVSSASGGAISNAMTAAGTASGRVFAAAFTVGVIAALVNFGPSLIEAITGKDTGGWKGIIMDEIKGLGFFSPKEWWKRFDPTGGFFQGKAAGGMIFPGQTRWVGENGPELANATPHGTMIYPGNRQVPSIQNPMRLPDLSKIVSFSPVISVQVERREILRAVTDQRNYEAARRGQER